MPFQKVVSEKISQLAVRQLETLILRGVLKPGQRLPAERDLADRLDVSRPTVREALKSLEARGLLVIKPNGGAFVAQLLGEAFSPALVSLFAEREEAVFDYLAFRREIEGLAAAWAALNATDPDRETISSVFARMEAAHKRRNPALEAEIDAEFHMSIVEAAHNVVMLHTMNSLYSMLKKGVFYNREMLYGRRSTRDKLLEEHRGIRDGVLAGDAEAAREAVHTHIDGVEAHMRDLALWREREHVAQLRLRQERERGEKAPRRIAHDDDDAAQHRDDKAQTQSGAAARGVDHDPDAPDETGSLS